MRPLVHGAVCLSDGLRNFPNRLGVGGKNRPRHEESLFFGGYQGMLVGMSAILENAEINLRAALGNV